jgi:hypothetical protein
MLGAYEGLMKSAPQGLGQPAQSMGGSAMPVGWKDTVPVAKQHALDIIKQMREIEDMYPDPNMDILPEHAKHYNALEGDLRQMVSSWEHGQNKAAEQSAYKNSLEGGGRTRSLAESLFDAGKGAIPPPPGKR